MNKLNIASNKLMGKGFKADNYKGDAIIGLSLGPVFTTCSPTYLFIIATILPSTFLLGFVYLLGFVIGLCVSLLLIAYFGQQIVNKLMSYGSTTERLKKIFAIIIIIIGLSIMTGYDKKLESYILDSGYKATINIEDNLLNRFAPKQNKININMNTKTITLAGGCFWCTEAFYQNKNGIIDAVSGYSGGDVNDADYITVSSGNTKHRESVQVVYDGDVISTKEILDIYWSHIDATDTGGQFADRGYQYTTAIYYHDDEQKNVAMDSKNRLEKSGLYDKPIATVILPFENFYKAEEYHQDYFKKAPANYENYKKGSGRDAYIKETWARDEAIRFLKSEKDKVVKSDYKYTDAEIAEKLKNLDPLAYHVVAENGTEAPFDNKYWDNKADGIYVDVLTKKPLFSSTHKYDSGTGWPSFWRTIDDDSVTLHEDNSLSVTRTEVRSDAGHVGHVFDDGPKSEGGRRFCTNSASLLFVPVSEMREKGYEKYLYLFE